MNMNFHKHLIKLITYKNSSLRGANATKQSMNFVFSITYGSPRSLRSLAMTIFRGGQLFGILFAFSTLPIQSMEIANDKLIQFPFEVPHEFQSLTEVEARDRAQREYCLCDEDVVENWRSTFILYTAFWHYHRNEAAVATLAQLGCPLAQVLQTFGDEEVNFNTKEELRTKLLSQHYEFLEESSNTQIIELLRDLVMYNATTSMSFLSKGMLWTQLKEEFDRIPASNDGRMVLPVDVVGPLFQTEGENQMDRAKQLRKACYAELLSRGNTAYLLYFFDLGSLTIGLSTLDRMNVYELSQIKYREKYGQFHPCIFQYFFTIPMFENTNIRHQLDIDYNATEDLIGTDDHQAYEATCRRLFEDGDLIWALSLGSYFESQNRRKHGSVDFDSTYANAKRWYTTALQSPTTKPFALKKLEQLPH